MGMAADKLVTPSGSNVTGDGACRCDKQERNCRNRERLARHCAPFISLYHCRVENKRGTVESREVLGNHRRQSEQSRLELGVCLSD